MKYLIIGILLNINILSSNNICYSRTNTTYGDIDIPQLIVNAKTEQFQPQFQLEDSTIQDTLIISPMMAFNINTPNHRQCDVLFLYKHGNRQSTQRIMLRNDSIIETQLLKGSHTEFPAHIIEREIKRIMDVMKSLSLELIKEYGTIWPAYSEDDRFISYYYQIIPATKYPNTLSDFHK